MLHGSRMLLPAVSTGQAVLHQSKLCLLSACLLCQTLTSCHLLILIAALMTCLEVNSSTEKAHLPISLGSTHPHGGPWCDLTIPLTASLNQGPIPRISSAQALQQFPIPHAGFVPAARPLLRYYTVLRDHLLKQTQY